MIGDHGSARLQRKSGRRSEIRIDFGDADNSWLPTDPRPNEKLVLARKVFEHLAKLGSKALGGQPRRLREKLFEPGSLQGADAELGENFLLADALVQRAQSRI